MPTSEPWTILKQLILLIVSALALYGLVLIVTYVLLPPPGPKDPIETLRADDMIYMTPAKEVYYGRRSLHQPGRKILVIGSSNVQVGFRPEKLHEQFPGYAVHNLGIGDSNITQVRQVRELAMAPMRDADIRNSIFVVGVWYGMFVDNASRWGTAQGAPFETDIDKERFRYGFWRRTETGPVDLIPESDTDRAARVIHPLIALERVARLMTAGLRNRIFVRPMEIDDRTRDTIVFTPEQRVTQVAYRRAFMNTAQLHQEQYDELTKLVREVSARGAKVIVVDLPLPQWHEKAVPYEAQHRLHMAAFVKANASVPGFSYLDMTNLDDDATFYDDAHVRPRYQGAWVQALSDKIRAVTSHRTALASN
jgi:hypothetical protein